MRRGEERRKRDGMFKRERTITGERREGWREVEGEREGEVTGERNAGGRGQEEEDAGEKGRSDRLSFKDPLFLHRGSHAPPFPPPRTPSRQKQLFLVECSVVVRVCGEEEWREGARD